MNGAMAMTYLADVKPFKTTWRVQVKVLHAWNHYTKQSGETFEMVLADQNGTKIHASVKKALMSRFKPRLTKGEWRVIENFSLTQVKGQYRVTNHPFKMGFVNNTNVDNSVNISDDVYLTLPDFQAIIVGDLNPFYLIDVLGQIVNVGSLDNIEANNKQTKKLEFEIRNTRNDRLPCTIWGSFAEQVFKACNSSDNQMVICLIRFAKINTFKGVNQITTAFDTSDIIINPVYPEVAEFRASLPTDGLALTISESKPRWDLAVRNDDFFNQYPRKTIASMFEFDQVQKCKIMCTILGIDTDMGWFYIGCRKCSKKVEQNKKNNNSFLAKSKKTTYWCPKCSLNVTQVVPRFKLHVHVMDQTAETKCLLFDGTTTEIVGQSANDLLDGVYDDDLQDPDKLPLAIKNLVGKTFQFLICVENDNLQGGNDTYKVCKIWSGTDMSKIEDFADSEGTFNSENIISGEQDILMLTNSSEATDVSDPNQVTPTSKRTKETDLEGSSTNKKICLKAVKVEKDDEKAVKVLKTEEKKTTIGETMKGNAEDPIELETNDKKF